MKQLITSLGATDKEAETFLRLLELGPQTATILAKHIGTPRSTMYVIMAALKDMGLIEEFERSGVKYFKTVPVREISDVINAKKRKLDQTEQLFTRLLPDLESKQMKLTMTPKVRFFEGKDQVMKMYEQVLREESFCAFVNPALVKEVMPEYYDKIPQMIKREKREVRELLVDNKVAHEYQKNYASKRHQMKFLPKKIEFPSDTIICREKIYMISYGTNDLSALEIYNASLAKSQQEIFEMVWKG
jgi:sugar-specific transcriptional regulator TrmB